MEEERSGSGGGEAVRYQLVDVVVAAASGGGRGSEPTAGRRAIDMTMNDMMNDSSR